MQSDADTMIAALDGFVPHPLAADDEYRLYAITSGFDTVPDKSGVLPAMFALMERCPAADLGTPGPLVHAIESLGIPAYEARLAESVRRRPMYTNVSMVTRILNAEREPARREQWINLLRGVYGHPAAADTTAYIGHYFARRGIPLDGSAAAAVDGLASRPTLPFLDASR